MESGVRAPGDNRRPPESPRQTYNELEASRADGDHARTEPTSISSLDGGRPAMSAYTEHATLPPGGVSGAS